MCTGPQVVSPGYSSRAGCNAALSENTELEWIKDAVNLCHLQNIAEKREDVSTDDCGEIVRDHSTDERTEVPQLLQDAFGPSQLFLQLLPVSQVEVNGLVAFVWLFSIFHVQSHLLVRLIAFLFHLGGDYSASLR